ncbi:response regulator receiver domain-containing protein [Azorhizobium sp. AG788]|uniref:response regulator transcription factor n=3 Tax=Azorhizobium TaxID=6 RepID=UPI0010F29B6B|nr:response regulator [Azorhizobium sp. AG788]TDT93547.1 response regulator receiver domain-containing protein [Azorhizobium sp. AG788]
MTAPLIAFIDDDPAIGEAIANFFAAYDYEAAVFNDAETFLASTAIDRADCIITDVRLGGMSGLDLLDRLRARPACPPVIVITAFPQDAIRNRALSAGATAFFLKPLPMDELLASVMQALAKGFGGTQ